MKCRRGGPPAVSSQRRVRPGDTSAIDWSGGTRPREPSPASHGRAGGAAMLCDRPSRRCRSRCRRGITSRGGARPPPGPRGQERGPLAPDKDVCGCAITRRAHTSTIHAWASTSRRWSRRFRRPRPRASLLRSPRFLASIERSDRGSRDRGRDGPRVRRPRGRRAHRSVQARRPASQAGGEGRLEGTHRHVAAGRHEGTPGRAGCGSGAIEGRLGAARAPIER